MRFRRKGEMLARPQLEMTPMIDVVFQLLIFFMLTLRIVEPEGDFRINMPIGAPNPADASVPQFAPLKVRMIAGESGLLAQLLLDGRQMGNGDAAFERLNQEILRAIGGQPGGALNQDIEVEIDADFDLRYEYTIRAVSACIGRIDRQTGQVIRYVEKVKFAPPRQRGKT